MSSCLELRFCPADKLETFYKSFAHGYVLSPRAILEASHAHVSCEQFYACVIDITSAFFVQGERLIHSVQDYACVYVWYICKYEQ